MDELNFDSLDNNKDSGGSSASFGGGLEWLMNPAIKENSSKFFSNTNNDLADVSNLDKDLNELDMGQTYKPQSDMFSGTNPAASAPADDDFHIRFSDKPFVGQASSIDDTDAKTWDGYGKFNEIPVNPDHAPVPQMSKEETLKQKLKLLRQFETIEREGKSRLTKKYTMDSPLFEMQAEMDALKEEQKRIMAISGQKTFILRCMQGIEWINAFTNPFGVELNGFTEELEESMNDDRNYDEVLEQLYIKYKDSGNVAPELKLAMMLGLAGATFVGKKKFASMLGLGGSAGPQMNAMNQFADVSQYVDQGMSAAMMQQHNANLAAAQARAAFQQQHQAQQQQQQQQAQQQPAFMETRGGNNSTPFMTGRSPLRAPPPPTVPLTPRQEMRGPRGDINSLLSGLKTRTIDLAAAQPQPQPRQQQQPPPPQPQTDNQSTVSIDDHRKEDGVLPKRTKPRRPRVPTTNDTSLNLDL